METLYSHTCRNCSGKMDFESKDVLREIDCPHCGVRTTLVADLPPEPSKPVAKPPVKERVTCWPAKIVAFILFVIGGGMTFLGCAGDMSAKSAMQQAPAYTEWCSGLILCALAVILGTIAGGIEDIANK